MNTYASDGQYDGSCGTTILCTNLAFALVAAGTGLVSGGSADVVTAVMYGMVSGMFGLILGIIVAPLIALCWAIVRHFTGESLLTAILFGGILCGGLTILFSNGDAEFDGVMWLAFMGAIGGTIYTGLMALFGKGT